MRATLLDLLGADTTRTDTAWRTEAQHDPTEPLRALTTLRERTCDGPTRTRSRAADCDLDQPWPTGPTADWNLVAGSRRTHGLWPPAQQRPEPDDPPPF